MSTCFYFGVLLFIAAANLATAETPTNCVVCAGGTEVFLLDVEAAGQGKIEKRWSWSAASVAGLTAEQVRWFRNLDECKPVDEGRRMLVCASNSGCGLIDRATGKLLWSTSVTNAHSVELLPGRRVAVASSLSGDRLVLFDLRGPTPETPVWKTPLRSAHGLVWDDERQCLWALGYDVLQRYERRAWDSTTPSLELRTSHPLPDADGHDLRPVPDSAELLLTTGNGVFLFDRATGRFRRHPTVGELAKVKAIDVHPATGRTVYSTWGPKLTLFGPTGEVLLPGQTVYKVRWFRDREPE